jgi:hypothetical protein
MLACPHKLEQEESFVDNIRYKRLTCEDWILSLFELAGREASLVRWRTRRRHH